MTLFTVDFKMKNFSSGRWHFISKSLIDLSFMILTFWESRFSRIEVLNNNLLILKLARNRKFFFWYQRQCCVERHFRPLKWWVNCSVVLKQVELTKYTFSQWTFDIDRTVDGPTIIWIPFPSLWVIWNEFSTNFSAVFRLKYTPASQRSGVDHKVSVDLSEVNGLDGS